MFASRLALICSLLVLPGVAMAEEEVVKSNRAALPAATETTRADVIALPPTDTKAQFMSRLNEEVLSDEKARIDYESWAGAEEDYKKRRVHGSASVSVGTGGYRSASVSAVMPVGDNGWLGLAYSQTDFGENGAYPYMYDDLGYGYGYGHGYGRYGRGGRGGTSQSFALSFESNSAGEDGSGCPSAFHERYDDPVVGARFDRRCMRPRD
ncbi:MULTISPECIES: hypothetical protein [Asticcacaulis]|uniref:hypothetical protein n=1 Tax=Asticcacaulis TaxID=76890 RepID=UPI001AE56726|nr:MULTISPECIES: hypothetical protein [Asticcacaulis]MBP2157514.1 hypothetical protein [Asticcacaulis solisilvae]MDR6798559.1 hypothetical protein [Asticcacaulis sp. BE141]